MGVVTMATGKCQHRWWAFVEMSKDEEPEPIKRWKRCLNLSCRRRVNLPLHEEREYGYSTVSMYDVPTIRPPAP